MKKVSKRFLSIWMALVLTVTMFQITGINANADDKKYVTVCIERFTIGQGYFVEPTLVEISDGETAAHALISLFDEKGIEYNSSGSVAGKDFYLRSIKGADNGVLDIPSYITQNGGPSNDTNDGNSDEYLGEFDYSSMAGWMITVNNEMIPVGSAQFEVNDGDVIRWQFTLWGYGADLGCSTGWGSAAYFNEPDKSALIQNIAKANEKGTNFISNNQTVYNQAKETATSAFQTQTQVDAASIALEQALNSSCLISKASELNVTKLPYTIGDAAKMNADYLLANVTDPAFGSIGGEWAVLQVARSGYITEEFKEKYLNSVCQVVKEHEGVLHDKKVTENARAVIALTSLGISCDNYEGFNLLQPFSDYDQTIWQGINGPVYSLIALDTLQYDIPTAKEGKTQNTREKMIEYILSKEIEGGGWTIFGTNADPDMTSMTIQGLAPYYNTNENVKNAVDRGLSVLATMQNEQGGYVSWGTQNSESVAQVICALCALGIDPAQDSRFVKTDGSWLLSNLLSFAVKDGETIGFAHTGTTVNQMATEQAGYALAAYSRLLEGKSSLYDMRDTQQMLSTTGTLQGTGFVLPELIENVKGREFSVILQSGSFAEGMKMFDGVIKIPDVVEITDVEIAENISGGILSWNVDSNMLRFVYGDLTAGNNVTIVSETDKKVFTIKCKLKDTVKEADKISFCLDSFRQITGPNEFVELGESTIEKDIALVKIDVSADVLYTGSGKNFIPEDKKAVKVLFAGIDTVSNEIGFQVGNNEYSKIYYSEDYSKYSGNATYVMVTDKDTSIEELNNVENYKIYQDKTLDKVVFADTNEDGVIDAQDALNEVSLWLRKAQKDITTKLILTYNVNGDGGIDSLDALAVVDYFVSSSKYPVMN